MTCAGHTCYIYVHTCTHALHKLYIRRTVSRRPPHLRLSTNSQLESSPANGTKDSLQPSLDLSRAPSAQQDRICSARAGRGVRIQDMQDMRYITHKTHRTHIPVVYDGLSSNHRPPLTSVSMANSVSGICVSAAFSRRCRSTLVAPSLATQSPPLTRFTQCNVE